jgi:YD repeat-containing protein
LPQIFPQLQDVIAAFFAQLGNVGFAHRFAAIGKSCVEQRCDHAATDVAARDRQQTQHLGFDPAGFAVSARWFAALRRVFLFSTGKKVVLDAGFLPQQARAKTQNKGQKREVNQPSSFNTHQFFLTAVASLACQARWQIKRVYGWSTAHCLAIISRVYGCSAIEPGALRVGSGNIKTLVDPVGAAMNFSYDGKGNLTRELDALGNPVTRTYDTMGRLLKETHVRQINEQNQIMVMDNTYSAKGELLESKSADGGICKTTYRVLA